MYISYLCFLYLPSTSDVRSVTFAALRLPAGKLKPILSNFSLSDLPPFLDLALQDKTYISFYTEG